jgi:cbb3-type cytochrome oxidase subunit 1/mono/diheme cytochrome c family protein
VDSASFYACRRETKPDRFRLAVAKANLPSANPKTGHPRVFKRQEAGKVTSELTAEASREDKLFVVSEEAVYDDRVARLHIRVALVFLALSSVFLTIAAARLVFPDSLSDVAILSYGRLLPAALDLFLYGWLTIGLIGAGYYIVPRMAQRPLKHGGLAVFGGSLLATGYLAGSIAVLLGGNEGRQYLEFPMWADAIVLVGLLAVARVFTGTIAQDRETTLAPAEWFFGSAPVWLLLAHISGSIPGLRGVNVALQASFYRGALFGLWFTVAGIGVVYYLVSSITGRDPRRITQLSVAGFWSLGSVFALSGAARLTYSAAPDWHETLGTVFAIGLLLPVAIVALDVATALRGSRSGRGVLPFVIAGLVAFSLVPILTLGLGLRSSSTILGNTEWVAAIDLIAVAGAFTFWLIALVHQISGTRRRSAKLHFAASMLGVLVIAGTMLVSGLQAGLTWLADANSGVASVGEGFRATVSGLDGHLWIRFGGFGLFALAQVWLAVSASRTAFDGVPAEVLEDDLDVGDDSDDLGGLPEGRPVGLKRLRTGTVGVFGIVVLFSFVFPALESAHSDATLLAENRRDYRAAGQAADGRAIYLAEGCWYCHTQQVRAIVTDVGLGPVAQPGDYALEDGAITGVMRVGPDLMFAGSRFVSADSVIELLEDPRRGRPWSTMPAHDYLSRSDLEDLAAYVTSLTPYEFG